MKKLIVTILLIVGLLVRLYKINSPIADWHSWRQADTAAVARNFIASGYNALYPKFDDLSSLPSGKENPNGYRFVEFPIFNFFHAGFYQGLDSLGILGKLRLSFEAVGRLTTVISSLAAAAFLYLIVKDFLGFGAAVLAMFFYLFLPFNIYYSRTVLPEQLMIAFALISMWIFLKCKMQKSKIKMTIQNLKLFLSILFASLAILVKPYALFILFPTWLTVFGGEWLKAEDKKTRKRIFLSFIFYLLNSIFLFLCWRLWMSRFPEGIPASGWLFNFSNIRLRPAWWRWLFSERLGKLILGDWGLILLAFGVAGRVKSFKKEAVFYGWLLGIFVYFVVFAGGNITHDYYQVLVIPVLSVFLAKGVIFLLRTSDKYFYFPIRYLLLASSFVFTFAFSWYQIKEYYKINHPEIIEAGKFIDENTASEAKVIAPYNGDTAFLYQTNRQGWPLKNHILYDLLQMGANYYVSVDLTNIDEEVKGKCDVMRKEVNWIVYDLKTCR